MIFVATVLFDRKCSMDAYTLCHDVLSQLGEEIPESAQNNQIFKIVEATTNIMKNISDSNLLEMKEMDERHCISMAFYNIIAQAAYFVKPEMIPFLACKMVQLTMNNGICKYSILGFVKYAGMLCTGKIVIKDIEDASRIGKAAMSCWMHRYQTTEQLPNLYLVYYGYIAFHTEPLQVCADMLRQGFDVGMSLGETSIAFFNSTQHIKMAFMAGDRLPSLLEKVDHYLKLTNTYQNEIAKVLLSIHRETISILMDNGGASRSTPHAVEVPTDTANEKVLGMIYFRCAIQAYWQGHNERCQHYIKKIFLSVTSDAWQLLFITFIDVLNSFQMHKTKPYTRKLKSMSKKAIKELKTASSRSSWNFLNKVRYDQTLLDAIVYVFTLTTKHL